MLKLDYSKLHRKLLRLHSLGGILIGGGFAFPPLIVQIEVTHKCNLRCRMCFQGKNEEKRTELNIQEIKSIIDQTPPWSIITLTGGEPTFREDFYEILDYGLSKRKCNMVTNASMINEELIKLFIDRKLLLLGISLDGLKETHDRVRGISGLYDKIVETIGQIQSKKKERQTRYPMIDLKTTILTENISSLFSILKAAESLGANFASFSLPKLSDIQFNEPYGSDIDKIFSSAPMPPDKPSSKEMEYLKEEISRIKNYRGKVNVRFYPYNMLDFAAVDKYYTGHLRCDEFSACYMPWSLLCISPYGDVYPCLSYNIGNIREYTLKELWNGRRFRDFRLKLDRKKISGCCLGCCYSEWR